MARASFRSRSRLIYQFSNDDPAISGLAIPYLRKAHFSMAHLTTARLFVYRLTALLVLWLGIALLPTGANALQNDYPAGQLLMVTSSTCPWCEAFEDEVGHGYARTEDAKILPLRRHDFYAAMPSDLVHITPATMTPTFIIIKNGEEIGRIIGYPGAELFWWRLAEFTTP